MKIINELILIDDDKDFLFLYQELLTDHDFFSSMVSFTTSEEAYRYMLSNEPSGRNIVITDLNLQLVKAWDFIDDIDRKSPELFDSYSFYVCSCSSYYYDIKRVKSHHRVVDFLDKPIDFGTLKASLQSVIEIGLER